MISSPLQLSGCVIWLDGTDTATLSTLSAVGMAGNALVGDLSAVGCWTNKGSLSAVGPTGNFTNIGGDSTTRPTYIASLSSVRFDGSNDYLTLSATQTYTAQTTFVVTSPRAFVTNAGIYTQSAAAFEEGATYSPLHQQNTTGGVLSFIDSFGGAGITSHRALSTFDIFTSFHTGSQLTNFRNAQGSVSNDTLGVFNVVRHRIGAGITSGGSARNFYSGDISEVIVYNRALTNTEREDVEYYLTRKWQVLNNIPRVVYALKNGNLSDPTTLSIRTEPSPWNNPILRIDDVYSNSYTVTVDQNVTCQSLRTTALFPNIAAGGTFAIYQPYSITASPSGFLAGTTTCITSFVSSGTVSLSGNVTGGSAAAAYGVANLSSANVSISGNILGGTNGTAYGAFLDAAGTLTVTGNVSGSASTVGIYNNNPSGFVYVNAPQVVRGGSAAGCHGIRNHSAGNCYVTGNILGGTNATAHGVLNASVGAVIVRGNVEAGSGGTPGAGIVQSSDGSVTANGTTGTVIIDGNLYASQISTGGQAALISVNAAARNEITGAIFNADGGRQAIYAARYLVRPKVFDSFTFHKNTEITNLLLQSEGLNTASWALSGSTVVANITGTPLSNTTLSAEFLVDTPGAANSHLIRQAVSTTLSTANVPNTLVFSIYGKPVQRRYVVIGIDSAPTSGGTTYNGTSAFSVVFDLSAGTTLAQKSTGSASLTLSSIENAGNGWWRCVVQGRINNSSATWNTAPFVAISDRTDYSAPVASEHYPIYAAVNTLTAVALWGAQYEYTSMTPYVSTTTTQGYGNRPTSPPFFYYSPEAYALSYVPQASSVRIGTTYAAVSTLSGQTLNIAAQLTGTMSVPNPSVVSYGTLVDHTSGTALNSSQSVLTLWNTQISTLTVDNLIGTRIANVATFMDVGSALETLKY